MDGTIVTFYSYKGGVGRSFTLANVAILLARWGHRVLTIDWDLEAPGLHEYFAPLMDDPPRTGIVDLVADFKAGDVGPTSAYITHLDTEDGVVDLIAAGAPDDRYSSRVQGIDWADLYEHGFADILERCRKDWVSNYDFVLIDSRTGWADIASICTAHLPDRLVLVFTANEQSIKGAVSVVHRANEARDRMPYDRPSLAVLPVLSRFDSRVEYERAEKWYQMCTAMITPLFSNWLARHVEPSLIFRHLTLPYVSYWSFGEQLPVREERVPSADQIAYALETITAIVAHGFDRTDLLADNRDAYVAASRGQAKDFELDILVSSPRSAQAVATAMVDELRKSGVRANTSLSGDLDFLGKARDTARHLCLVVDDRMSRWQQAEAEWFLRRTLVADDRRLFPVLTKATNPAALPGFLRNLRRVELRDGLLPREVAKQLRDELTASAALDVNTDMATLEYALSVLRKTWHVTLHFEDWFVIEQNLRELIPMVRTGQLESLRAQARDLELASKARAAPGGSHEAPANVQALITALTDDLNRRIKNLSRP